MIHVCYGLYDGNGRYSKFTGTSILSLFENTREKVTVHILHDNTLTDDNRDKFSYIAGQYNQLIKFYNVEKICADEIAAIKGVITDFIQRNFSIGALFRLLITKIFPEDITKIIYFDSDIIVNLDISELWKIPLEDKAIAAIPEFANGSKIAANFALCKEGLVNAEDYFNSGVLVINLETLRGRDYQIFQNGIKFICENPKYAWMDQDILNYCFSKNMVKLPSKFNFFVRDSIWRNEFKTENRILHYLSGSLNLDMRNPFNRLWFGYFKKTQWFNEDVIAHLNEELVKMNNTLKNLALQVSALMSGKVRAFFTDKANLELLKKAFRVREGEEIIPAVNNKSVQALADSMKASAGKKVYFILISNYYLFVRADLINAGFVEGRDFVNAVQFLSETHGVKLETNNFIKAL